jgi:hypothetical protein
MSAQKAFRLFTSLLMGCLLLSILLHGVLLSFAESGAYRSWVMIQIGLQLFGVALLWYVRRYQPLALVAFAALSIPFTYINAVYVNYGHSWAHLLLAPLFWITFGALVLAVKREFLANARQQRQHDA